jgi:hypothetical protein
VVGTNCGSFSNIVKLLHLCELSHHDTDSQRKAQELDKEMMSCTMMCWKQYKLCVNSTFVKMWLTEIGDPNCSPRRADEILAAAELYILRASAMGSALALLPILVCGVWIGSWLGLIVICFLSALWNIILFTAYFYLERQISRLKRNRGTQTDQGRRHSNSVYMRRTGGSLLIATQLTRGSNDGVEMGSLGYDDHPEDLRRHGVPTSYDTGGRVVECDTEYVRPLKATRASDLTSPEPSGQQDTTHIVARNTERHD